MRIECAMLLAAGLGSRLRPMTERTPKPLVRVGGKALIDYGVERFVAAGVRRMVVNTHHLGEQVEAHLRERYPALDIQISREATLLETGGAVVKALPAFEGAPFFCTNTDVLWLDGAVPALTRLASAFDPARMDACLLLHPRERAVGYRGPGNFALAPDGGLVRGGPLPYVFTGLQILSPGLFRGRAVEPFSLRELYAAAEQPDLRLARMAGLAHDGEWVHVGSPEELAEANAFLGERDRGAGPKGCR